MASKYMDLDDILNDTDFGDIFTIKPKAPAISADSRLIESFEEINRFIDENQRAPQESSDISERKLFSRLQSLRGDSFKCELLQQYDRHTLLSKNIEHPQSIDDLLQDDFLANLLNDDKDSDIFTLKHITHSSERQETDFVARRKPCKNFAEYEPLFKQCQQELKAGIRKLIRFNESNLMEKTFFIINGVLGYLETIYDLAKDKNSKLDGRTYCVFENGTESNMLFRSLGKMLYDNGQIVSSSNSDDLAAFNQGFATVDNQDKATGFIYILKSKSKSPKIADVENLFKIGYSTTPVEERIKNAENDPTYLMAPVEIIAVYECYNLNPQKFEHIIHTFFAEAGLKIDVFTENNQRITPREWFVLPLPVINQAIELIISGGIISYHYNWTNGQIVKN